MKTKLPAGEKLTVGLDLGDRRHCACVLDAAGEILAEEVIVNTGTENGVGLCVCGEPSEVGG